MTTTFVGGFLPPNPTWGGAVAVTPSDSTVFTPPLVGLYVGGSGNLAVTMNDGTSVTFSAVPVGTFLPVSVSMVLATNTTATLIIGGR